MGSKLLPWLQGLSSADWNRMPAGRWESRPPSDPGALARAESRLAGRFPDDYRDLILASNGGALTGPKDGINFEPVEELADRNADEQYEEALPGMVVIGDNGGGSIYFYDPSGRLGQGKWALYWVALGDLALGNARFAGVNLTEALERIASGVSFFDEPSLK